MLNEKLAKHIRYCRTTKQMTLTDLSQHSDIDYTYLGRVERNEINITINTLEKIIRGLDMEYGEFFGFLNLQDDDPELFDLVQRVKKSAHREKSTQYFNYFWNLTDPLI